MIAGLLLSMKYLLFLSAIIGLSVFATELSKEYIYNPSTDDAFIDDAFPAERKEYQASITRWDTVQLVDYDNGNKRIVKTIKKQQVNPEPVQPQLEQPTLELEEPKTEKTLIGTYKLSRYYTPVKWQSKYWNGNYQKEFSMNCQWNCRITANGHYLEEHEVWKVVACPKNIKLGTRLLMVYPRWWEFEVTCHDRWWAIKGMRLDLRCWVGQEWYDNIFKKDPTPCPSGKVKVYKLD